ncbi:MAG: STAS domain-containing protein, partial [Spirochaetia bacterium]|nr:STAS domain-containing protein [Spirochaetia bacterium]
SSGLGGLIKAFNHVQGCNGRFCLANPAGPIQAILEISGATAYLEVLSAESYAERYGALDGAG